LKETLQRDYGVHDLTDERIDIQTLFQALYSVKFL
jgi:hypothetical protein